MKSLRVLIVEDDAMVAGLLAETLESYDGSCKIGLQRSSEDAYGVHSARRCADHYD